MPRMTTFELLSYYGVYWHQDLDASVCRDAVQAFLAADDGQVADRSVVTAQATNRLVRHVRIPQSHQPIHSCDTISRLNARQKDEDRQWQGECIVSRLLDCLRGVCICSEEANDSRV